MIKYFDKYNACAFSTFNKLIVNIFGQLKGFERDNNIQFVSFETSPICLNKFLPIFNNNKVALPL